MVKKEVGAIIVALLLVATLGAGVASAEGVVLGGGYNDTSVDTSSFIFSEFFTTDLWNGSFWDSVAEEEVEAVKKARAARDVNETAEAVEKARAARAANETAEESPSLWLPGDKTHWPAGYWDVDPNYKTHWPAGYWDVDPNYQSDFAWYDPGYGAVNWTIP
uniref:Uncharacterized protein n=1 Tax=Candidatus Methanophaga sp. ANME-1 ERB7 TaxID=2759913 RepID=A0A7G9ZC02_9EURY|nr:hypothetical protein OHAEDELL_00013 [Methanosarcinales archaeon ANME-1 ERB7]